jgi:hypothetical protein
MNLPKITLCPFQDASEPLRSRAPSHDENGKALSDFMMLFPGLKDKPESLVRDVIAEVQLVLTRFGDRVVFAEFNQKLSLLWVSTKAITGLRFEIACAIQERVPEARLVSHI